MNEFFDNRRIIDTIWKRRVHFVIVGIIAIVLATIFSSPFFIPPKFKSTARLYPTNLSVMSEESESEQMLEVLNSVDIKIKMFDAFNLPQVYKINRDDPKYLTYMLGVYNKNVAARKTEFETVELEVLDADPQRAKLMCDSLIHFYNLKVREMHAAKNWEMVEILNNNIRQRSHERDSIIELLSVQRENYQILDVYQQVPEVTRGYMKALAEGRENTSGMREIKKLYENIVKNGAEAYVLERNFNRLTKSIDSLQTLYEVNLSEANKVITYAHVVDNPLVPDKKSYPVRWMIVAFSLFSTLLAALLAFMFIDYKKES